MLLPGITLVQSGVIHADLWSMLMGMTRMPTTVGFDCKAVIAANNVATGRPSQLFERYGLDTVHEVMRHDFDHSERELRQVLGVLPDGVFRAVDWIEHDGHENNLSSSGSR